MEAFIARFEKLVILNRDLERNLQANIDECFDLKHELNQAKDELAEKEARIKTLAELIDQQENRIEVLESQLEMVGGKPTGNF
jgi:chromosome segregation ATPase